MGVVALMAAVFGTVACLFFLLLEPVINSVLNPEDTIQGVTYPEEKPEEELTPEEMVENEEEMVANMTQELIREEVEKYFREGGIDAITYDQIVSGLHSVADDCKPWLADVSVITEDVDWFNSPYENRGTKSGIVIAQGDEDILVLVCNTGIDSAQKIQIQLNGGLTGTASIQGYDKETGLAVLRVSVNGLRRFGDIPEEEEETEETDEEAEAGLNVTEEELDLIGTASLGTSAASVLTGKSVIAVGRPAGTEGSVSYGFVSAVAPGISVHDAEYKQITTDIYGSAQSSGVLVNLKGEVVGIVDPSHSRTDMPDALCGIGITELKVLIEHLSAGKQKPYFGIFFTDVPASVRVSQNIPAGVYVSAVEDDSPSMIAGLQKGDILQKAGDTEINSAVALARYLLGAESGTAVQFTVARPAGNEYSEMILTVVPE